MSNPDDNFEGLPNTGKEYFTGKTADGKPLRFRSKELIPPWQPKERPPCEKEQISEPSKFHTKAKSQILQAQQQMVEDQRAIAANYRDVMKLGQHATRVAESALVLAEARNEFDAHCQRILNNTIAKAETLDDLPEDLRKQVVKKAGKTRARSASEECGEAAASSDTETGGDNASASNDSIAGASSSRAPSYRISIPALIALGLRAAKLLAEHGPKLVLIEEKYCNLNADAELRKSFLEDRAVCVVLDVFTKMDQEFVDLGFGNWMPFRYFDQMVAFVGILQRVLAARGLIKSDTDPDVYRRLLDETPPISAVSESYYCAPPQGIGVSYRTTTVKTRRDMEERIEFEKTIRKDTYIPDDW